MHRSVALGLVLALAVATGCAPDVPRRTPDHPASPEVDPAPATPPSKTLAIDRADLPKPAPEMNKGAMP